MLTQQTTELILGVIAIVFPVVWHWAGAQSKKAVQRFEQKLPEKQRAILENIVRHGVQMVEQRYADYSPEAKRKEAEQAIYAITDFFDYKPDPTVVRTLLESTVFSMKNALPPAQTVDASDSPTAKS